MHHVWEVPELRASIFEPLNARKEYAAAALVCKDFWASAIPLLWKEVNFKDILRLFGDAVRYLDTSYYDYHNDSRCAVFKQPLKETDVKRFRLHAVHIEKLDVQMPRCSCFPVLLQHLKDQRQPLWPRLQELVLRPHSRGLPVSGGRLLPILFGASLKHLSVILDAGLGGLAEAVDGIKTGIAQRVEALQTLRVTIRGSDQLLPDEVEEIIGMVSAPITSLEGIKLLLRPILPPEVVRAAILLPSLTRARFSFMSRVSDGYERLGGAQLTHLNVNGGPRPIKQLLQSPSSTSLVSLNLSVTITEDSDFDMQDIVDSISTVNGLEGLQTLTLHVLDVDGNRSITAYPVSTFQKVNRLRLDLSRNFPFMTAAELQIVAEGMPRLTHLFVGGSWLLTEPILSLHDLQPLGKNCPNLQFIRIGASGRAGDLNQLAYPMPSVTVVTLLQVRLDDPVEHVAEYVRRLWPNLRLGSTRRPYPTARQRPSWNAVWELIGAKDLTMPIWDPDEDDDWRETRQ